MLNIYTEKIFEQIYKLSLLKESVNLFSKVNAELIQFDDTINIDDNADKLEEYFIDEDWTEHQKSSEKKVRDIISKNANKEKHTGAIPFIHNKSISGSVGKKTGRIFAGIIGDNGEYDLEVFKKLISVRPKKILQENEKMFHARGNSVQFFNIGLPAMKSIAYNEEDNQFYIVNTCPGAGTCALTCFGMKGNYIRVKPSWLFKTRLTNYILNDPEGFKTQLIGEITKQYDALINEKIDVYIRWHDVGDFFSKDYLNIAFDVAKECKKRCPSARFYAYTKMASAVNANKPTNFLIRFSTGAMDSQEDKVGFSNFKGEVVPKEEFTKIITLPNGKEKLISDIFVMGQNGKMEKGSNGWMYIDPEKSMQTLKERIAKKYKFNINNLFSHDEYMKLRNKLSDEKKYGVFLKNGDSDYPASQHNVKTIFNLEH